MPAIFWLQCLALASSSRAWPAPTMLKLMAAINNPTLSFPHSGVGMPPVTLPRHATLERCRMNSHAGAWELGIVHEIT